MKKIILLISLIALGHFTMAQYNFPNCSPAFDPAQSPYSQGQEVSLEGINYQAKYWAPGRPGEDAAWEALGPCGDGGLGPAYQGPQRIIGYLPTWVTTYDIRNQFRPEVVTHLNIAFLMFKQNNNNYNSANFASIAFNETEARKVDSVLNDLGVLQKSKAKGVKVMVALGGATDYAFVWLMNRYYNNPTKINEIATLIANYVEQNGLDGVDLDMECWWPDVSISGTTEQGGRVRGSKWGDTDQGPHPAGLGLTQLTKRLRQIMPNKIISAAVFGTSWYGNNYDDEMVDYMDWLGLMTYDFTGSWDKSPFGPHSALYKVPQAYQGQTADNPIYSAEDALEYWMGIAPPTWNHAGGFDVPRSKLAFGVPMYGYDFSERKPAGGNGFKFVPYKDILAEFPNAATRYDPKDPRRLGGFVDSNGKQLYYNTPKLAAEKVNYSKNYGHQGLIIWELTQDAEYSNPSSLMRAINEAAGTANPINDGPVISWQSPSNGQVIRVDVLGPITLRASATDTDGVARFSFRYGNTDIPATRVGDTYSASFTPAAFGQVSVAAIAADSKNAVSESTITFTVQQNGVNSPPVISQVNPQNQAVLKMANLETVTIEATVTDDKAVDNVTFSVNNTVFTPFHTAGTSRYWIAWIPTTFGTVNLALTATDNEGAVANISSSFVIEQENIGSGCDGVAPWEASTIYPLAGQEVVYNGKVYKNKWWTRNEIPGVREVWEYVRDCGNTGGGGDNCSGIPAWASSTAYHGGAQVSYDQKIYTAKWWTRNETPGMADVWQYVSECVGTASLRVNESQVIVAQNLASDQVVFTVKTSNSETMKVVVTDHVGNTIYSSPNEDVGSGTHTFVNDISDLRKGLYFYKIQLGSKTYTRKVIKY